jgi:tetratricopeptide (TPR) repeat protein
MKRDGSLITSTRILPLVLPLALALLTIQLHAQTLPEAKCTGNADVPWREQITGCTKAIESSKYAGKDLAKAFTSRGNASAQTGDIDRSLADFDQAIRLDPNDAFAVGARGDLHLVRKDYEHAIADYTTAISIEPNNAAALTGRAIVHVVTGNPDRAIADCDQAIRQQPTFAAGLYWRGMAKCAKGDAAAGEADIAAARKIDPEVDR